MKRKQRFIPHVVEPSAGVDRTVLALICEAYAEDQAPNDKGEMESRILLRFHPRIAPIKCAVFPLLKNKEPLVAKAKEIVALLRPDMTLFLRRERRDWPAISAAGRNRHAFRCDQLISRRSAKKIRRCATQSPCAIAIR